MFTAIFQDSDVFGLKEYKTTNHKHA